MRIHIWFLLPREQIAGRDFKVAIEIDEQIVDRGVIDALAFAGIERCEHASRDATFRGQTTQAEWLFAILRALNIHARDQ